MPVSHDFHVVHLNLIIDQARLLELEVGHNVQLQQLLIIAATAYAMSSDLQDTSVLQKYHKELPPSSSLRIPSTSYRKSTLYQDRYQEYAV